MNSPIWEDVSGPLSSKDEAEKTMLYLGESNHSVYSRNDGTEWYVERNLAAIPDLIFGMTFDEIVRRQMKQ